MKKILLILSLFFIAAPALAEDKGNIVIDLADDHVDITSGFTGAQVTVFGTTDQDGDIAIVLRGPESRVVMRKKEPALGMWLNRSSVDFKHVPLFYGYAVSRSQDKIADAATLTTYGIGLNALQFEAVGYDGQANASEFQEALVRTQQSQGLFPSAPSPIRFIGQKLFKTSFYLPADVPVGQYQVESYLFREGALIDRRVIGLDVAQAGLSADILNFAVDHSFSYAMLGLMMAIISGFAAFWMSRSQRA